MNTRFAILAHRKLCRGETCLLFSSLFVLSYGSFIYHFYLLLLVSCVNGACFGVSVVHCLDLGCQLSKNDTSRVLLKPCLLFVYFHLFLFYLGLVLVFLCVSFVKKRRF